jgi:hypothetical protein
VNTDKAMRFEWLSKAAVFCLFLNAIVVLSGFATPVGVRRMDPPETYRMLTGSVLTGQNLSAPTMRTTVFSKMPRLLNDGPIRAFKLPAVKKAPCGEC